MQIRIYDHKMNQITTLYSIDVEGVVVENNLEGDGYAQFTLRADNAKINKDTVKAFNRVKVFDGSNCIFYGFISENAYTLNTIATRCYSMSNLLKKRVINYVSFSNTPLQSALESVLLGMNSNDETGISLGSVSISSLVTRVYEDDTVDYILNDMLGSNQFYVDEDGKLNVGEVVGENKTDVAIFSYDTRNIQKSNLLSFNVKESGQDLVSRVRARNGDGSIKEVATSAELQNNYGIIEKVASYYSVIDSTTLTNLANKDIKSPTITPELSLTPKVDDNFSVGDIVKVRIYNSFVDINQAYQVISKNISFVGGKKVIKISVNNKQKSFLDIINEQAKKIAQLEKK